MPKKYYCTSISLIVFKQQMLQAANTDLFNQLVPKAHVKIDCFLYKLSQEKSAKANWRILFLGPSTLMG